MKHKVPFKYPVSSVDDKFASAECSVHASKTPKLVSTDEHLFFSNIFFPHYYYLETS